ncbi:hypothetical protein H9Q13_01150 [Pontibacter sp. JH31]|uniref:EF-hand domain-containing protein n=1 Tax=Pontibacter aquaedesilientis TaxID=2766980 RepID=A0ABR7XDS6_9BACT|nr:hypothetical protein [Pontibacter aquaedesilientis]MBD1395758.1 hypothetical protein [Pontibacter aquaedesilientis]
MKNHFNNLKRYFRAGLTLFVLGGLAACGGNDKKDMAEDTAAVRTEKTGRFAGTASAIDGTRMYTDFAATDYFTGWDANNDNMLNKEEFATSFFSTWDTNGDNTLDKSEWSTAANDFGFKDNPNWDWAAWDNNKDNKLSMNEFNTQLAKAQLFENWDKNNNNLLDQREYADGLHTMWNEADADGTLNEEEYKGKFNKYYDSSQKRMMPERG